MPVESSPPVVAPALDGNHDEPIGASSDGPWHSPVMSRRSSINSRRSLIDSQGTVVSVSIEPLKTGTEGGRSSNVSVERSATVVMEEMLGQLSDEEEDEHDDDNIDDAPVERSIYFSPAFLSLATSFVRPSSIPNETQMGRGGSFLRRWGIGRHGSASSLPSRDIFLGHWRRGSRSSTASLPSSSRAAAGAVQSDIHRSSLPTDVGIFTTEEVDRGSFTSDSFLARSFCTRHNLHDNIYAALQDLDAAEIDNEDSAEHKEDEEEANDYTTARAAASMFGGGDVSGGRGGRSLRTIGVELSVPPPRGALPMRSSLKSPQTRKDWSQC